MLLIVLTVLVMVQAVINASLLSRIHRLELELADPESPAPVKRLRAVRSTGEALRYRIKERGNVR